MAFAAPVEEAAVEADEVFEATELATEEPAEEAELRTEEAFDCRELASELRLLATLPVAEVI
jgi:hypothetical protein